MTEETATDKAKTGIADFARDTRREIAKVTWPSRREVGMTTTMIVVFAIITGVFFLAVDSVLGRVVSFILGMSS